MVLWYCMIYCFPNRNRGVLIHQHIHTHSTLLAYRICTLSITTTTKRPSVTYWPPPNDDDGCLITHHSSHVYIHTKYSYVPATPAIIPDLNTFLYFLYFLLVVYGCTGAITIKSHTHLHPPHPRIIGSIRCSRSHLHILLILLHKYEEHSRGRLLDTHHATDDDYY